jgi:hypothetical protein
MFWKASSNSGRLLAGQSASRAHTVCDLSVPAGTLVPKSVPGFRPVLPYDLASEEEKKNCTHHNVGRLITCRVMYFYCCCKIVFS